MFKIMTMLFSFIKELFRDKKSELEFTNSNFSVLTYIRYLVFIFLVIYNVYITDRVVVLANANIALEEKLTTRSR